MNRFRAMKINERLLFASSFLMLFVFVLFDQIVPPLILIFFLTSIPFWRGDFNFKGLLLAGSLCVFYLLHVLSLTYSQNWEYAQGDLMTKLSFLLFPLMIVIIRDGYKVIVSGIKWGLILGSTYSMVYSLLRALLNLKGVDGDPFFPSNYALNMHTSYLSLIIIIAGFFFWQEKLNWKGEWVLKIAYTLLALLSLLFMRSLGAFVCLGSIIIIYPIWHALKRRNYRWLLVLPLLALLFFVGVKNSPRIENDFTTTINKAKTWNDSPEKFLLANKNSPESNTVRLVVWTLSSRILKDHPFGVGIGDVKDELEKKYRSYGYTYYAYNHLNPHNQFLQTGIAMGWLGIITLVLLFGVMFFYSFRLNDIALFLSSACILISCLFESMLERFVGVTLLCTVVMLIVLSYRLNWKIISEKE